MSAFCATPLPSRYSSCCCCCRPHSDFPTVLARFAPSPRCVLTMITPPLSICASPLFTPNVPKLEEPEAEPLVSGRWEPVMEREMGARCASLAGAGEPLPLMMVGCSADMLSESV